jgi:hypothetical protein
MIHYGMLDDALTINALAEMDVANYQAMDLVHDGHFEPLDF